MKLFLYNLRNLLVRRWRTLLTLSGVALVVAVFCYLMCFADGLRRALVVTGDPANVIVIAEAATAESNSMITRADVNKLSAIPHVGVDQEGHPLVSPEVVGQANVTRRGDTSGTHASAAIRGVDLHFALAVHPAVRLVAGRWFRPGSDEVVVGETAARQFNYSAIGSTLEAGERNFAVVGVFSAGGGAHESEWWGYLPNVAAAYRRPHYSSAVLRLDSADETVVSEATRRIASAGIALRGLAEPAYFATQMQNARLVEAMALVLMALMGTGAVFAAINTMFASVAGRTRELAMLRALGFTRRSLMVGILAESLALAVAGGLAGVVICAATVLLGGRTRDLVGTTTFTSVAFTLRISVANVLWSLAVAALIGLLGGLWPARWAARIPTSQALRMA